ncbi:DUF421 domain-containing protein [Phenylobacterium sp.]|jgi:uncharacterized membrane protein YcaP (DUF421 family)|uniref:DUF421 domain-containing protein n=1 Tax=Phenylobacterium sp. TaxID=1871053 RepID=UPI002F941A38
MDLADLHLLLGRQGDISWWQMSIRAVVIFLYGLALLRIASKRVFGKWSAIDIVLSVIIGSNLSRALTGSSPFLETLVATAVLVGVHGALVWAAARAHWLGPLLKGSPCQIGRDGRFDPAELRRHGIGPHDVEEALREAGMTGPEKVQEAWIERNGDISIIKR